MPVYVNKWNQLLFYTYIFVLCVHLFYLVDSVVCEATKITDLLSFFLAETKRFTFSWSVCAFQDKSVNIDKCETVMYSYISSPAFVYEMYKDLQLKVSENTFTFTYCKENYLDFNNGYNINTYSI